MGSREPEQRLEPSDYRDHRSLALSGLNLWENHGWMVWDRPPGEDVLLWLSPYRIVGRQPIGPFAQEDVSLSQTVLLRSQIQDAARTTMHDTPFLAVGYDLGDAMPADALEIGVTADAATWRIGRRTFTAAPPRWRITGEHAGVEVDLTLEAMGPPFWLADPGVPVEVSGERWFLQCARARGQIRHQGVTTAIDGYASHERHVHCGTSYDPPRLLSASGATWHSGSADGLQVIVMSRPSIGLAWARVVSNDRTAEFRSPDANCQITETSHWVDPLSRLSVPSAWEASFEGSAGRLEVRAQAFARAYYLWPNFRWGTTVLYWWLADAEVTYELDEGWRGTSRLQYIVHDNRLLYRQHRDD
jgi:hypothetical protein